MNDALPWLKFAATIVVFLGGLAGLWNKVSVRLALIEQKLEGIADNVTTTDCQLKQAQCPARREVITDVGARHEN
jgi:hypothetical protein